jgi:hypothetical protein
MLGVCSSTKMVLLMRVGGLRESCRATARKPTTTVACLRASSVKEGPGTLGVF